jgi:hypothetical protein
MLQKIGDATHWFIPRNMWVHHHVPGEKVGDRLVIAQMRCPKCKQYFTIVKGEIDERGFVRRKHRHSCGMSHLLFELEGFKPKPPLLV